MAAVTAPISGNGVSEDQWQTSAWLAALPAVSPGQLLAGVQRLVVVSPHPDDEVLACGGLILAALAAGLPVAVVSVTDGEACYPGQPEWPPQRLREVRRRELRSALDVLGTEISIQVLGLADGGVAAAEVALGRQLQALLGSGDLVLAPWVHDAHPDHEATGRAALQAADRRGARLLQYPVWAWHWLDPQAGQAPWTRAQRVSMPVDARVRKREAVACFASQTGAAGGLDCAPILPHPVLARFDRDYEVLIG